MEKLHKDEYPSVHKAELLQTTMIFQYIFSLSLTS